MFIGLYVKYPYSCQILMKLEFSRYVFENSSYFMKISPGGVEFFHADGLTGRHDETNSRFSQFCERKYIIQC